MNKQVFSAEIDVSQFEDVVEETVIWVIDRVNDALKIGAKSFVYTSLDDFGLIRITAYSDN